MSISDDLFQAILAMDAYNRGYNAGVNVTGNQIGDAIISSNSSNNPSLFTPASSPHLAQRWHVELSGNGA